MTQGKRVFLNVIATYGRSLYSLALGLFTSRWVLLSLGQVDYGLYGLVGGLVGLVSFVNNLIAGAVMRFYAVSVGAAGVAENRDAGIDECRKWFNTALMLHVSIPIVLVIVGYPIGTWVVKTFLVIPVDRLDACIWVWRFTCISCFVGMVSLPFNAMYSAKQEIAELTCYSFCKTTLNAIFFYYMVSHPGIWLTKYALWMCLISGVPNGIIIVRAVMKYPECRFRSVYLFDWNRTKQILLYASARAWTAFSAIISSQGRAILVNRFLGPAFNAAVTVGNNVVSQASGLSSSISTAFWPMIANTAGTGNVEKVKYLSFQVCRISTVMVLIFLIPLALEVDEVLFLWLKNPPVGSSQICLAVIVSIICERMSEGYWMAVMGLGKRIGFYSWVIGWSAILDLLLTGFLMVMGLGLWGVCWGMVIAGIVMIGIRLYMGRVIVGMSVRHWVSHVGLPILLLCACGWASGLVSRLTMSPSFLRVCITTICVELTLIPCAWHFALTTDERIYLMNKIGKKLPFMSLFSVKAISKKAE